MCSRLDQVLINSFQIIPENEIFLFFPCHSWNNTLKGLETFTDAGYPLMNSSDELTTRYQTILNSLNAMIQTNGIAREYIPSSQMLKSNALVWLPITES